MCVSVCVESAARSLPITQPNPSRLGEQLLSATRRVRAALTNRAWVLVVGRGKHLARLAVQQELAAVVGQVLQHPGALWYGACREGSGLGLG